MAQNYRSSLIHVSQLSILLVTNYYRSMKSNTPIEEKARIKTPAYIELALIALCLLVSFCVLVCEACQSLSWRKRDSSKERDRHELTD